MSEVMELIYFFGKVVVVSYLILLALGLLSLVANSASYLARLNKAQQKREEKK